MTSTDTDSNSLHQSRPLITTHFTIPSPRRCIHFLLSHNARFVVLYEIAVSMLSYSKETTFSVWDLLEKKMVATKELRGEALGCFSRNDRFLVWATTSELVVFDSHQDWQEVAKVAVHLPAARKSTLDGLVFDNDDGFVLLLVNGWYLRRPGQGLNAVVVNTSTWTERVLPHMPGWDVHTVSSTKHIMCYSCTPSAPQRISIAECDGQYLRKRVTFFDTDTRVGYPFGSFRPCFSPDRSTLIDFIQTSIKLRNINTHNTHSITRHRSHLLLLNVVASHNNRFLAIIEGKPFTYGNDLMTKIVLSLFDLHTNSFMWRNYEDQFIEKHDIRVSFSPHDRFVITHLGQSELSWNVHTGEEVYRHESTHKPLVGQL
ncbi:MAG: hypothetical protein MI748_10395, partial [Opitutales bacterium]|nr:hypothetical protein [Opitutales bacterium]